MHHVMHHTLQGFVCSTELSPNYLLKHHLQIVDGWLTALMFDHCEVYQLTYPAQKGYSRGQYGCVDHLLITNSMWYLVCSKYCSLSVA